MDKQKYICPHCGARELVWSGLQWWPVWVVQKQGWSPYQYSEDGKHCAVRLYICQACHNSFMEPSLA